MRLISFKTLKAAVIVICMLAAGICYICGGRPEAPDAMGNQGISLDLDKMGQEEPESGPEEPGHPDAAWTETGRPDTAWTETGQPDAAWTNPAQAKTGHGQEESGPEAAGQTRADMVYVHVCGEVREPGVYGLPEGSRVYEAVAAAGGVKDSGAPDYLNLAETLKDGMKLEVPSQSQAEEWKAQGMAAAGHGAEDAAPALVNLNTASREELMSLRGIGQSRAEDIIRYREKFGGFQSIEDIMNVSGIKDAAFEKIKDSITV